MDIKEAIAVLFELGTCQLINPSLVVLEQNKSDKYQLNVKGEYNFGDVAVFLKNRLCLKEVNNYLVIFKT